VSSSKGDALAKIVKEVSVCQKCPLYKLATRGVPGEGSPNADIVFIGEGPGKEEDKQGRPFCGAAGKLLDELIESIGLKRADVYIGNVVKHRPPNNRDPQPEEIEACWPYLMSQIEIINPKVVVTLGRHSLGRLMPGLGTISQLHGRAFKKDGRVYMALYHPAVALYAGRMKQVLMDDFKKLKLLLNKISSE
jgi:DNA polymerase